jgi:hypothetical protein
MMSDRNKTLLKQATEWETDPYRILGPQLHRLLHLIREDYNTLSKSGTPLDYRIAVARYAAEAKGLLYVVNESSSVRYKGDIL